MKGRTFWNVGRNESLFMDKREQRSNTLQYIGAAAKKSQSAWKEPKQLLVQSAGIAEGKNKVGRRESEGYLIVSLLNNCSVMTTLP